MASPSCILVHENQLEACEHIADDSCVWAGARVLWFKWHSQVSVLREQF